MCVHHSQLIQYASFLNVPDGDLSGGSLYILRVNGLAEADAIAADEPLHQAGLTSVDVRPMAMRAR